MPMTDYDVIVAGGGVVGCAAARELARYRCRVALVERAEDVCAGTSKANSAIVHAGFDAKPGTAKARFNLLGNRRMEPLARELDFEFIRNGSLVLCLDEADRPKLAALAARGLQNGVPGLRLLTGEEARRLEPNLSARCVAALYAPTGGIVCPFGLTIALAENACDNGVDFHFLTAVTAVARTAEGYRLETCRGPLTARAVVKRSRGLCRRTAQPGQRAAADHHPAQGGLLPAGQKRRRPMCSTRSSSCRARPARGCWSPQPCTAICCWAPPPPTPPTRKTPPPPPPSSTFCSARRPKGWTGCRCGRSSPPSAGCAPTRQATTLCWASRPTPRAFLDAAGIESPGLTSAPAIGLWLAEQTAARLGAEPRAGWNPRRRGILRAAALPAEERRALVAAQPAYGAIVCRCEQISEGEILDALHRTLGAKSMDGLKRRVRQGMGRCQGGFCTPRAMELLAEALGVPMEQICKNEPGSCLIHCEEATR